MENKYHLMVLKSLVYLGLVSGGFSFCLMPTELVNMVFFFYFNWVYFLVLVFFGKTKATKKILSLIWIILLKVIILNFGHSEAYILLAFLISIFIVYALLNTYYRTVL
jgi:hypothetical protein